MRICQLVKFDNQVLQEQVADRWFALPRYLNLHRSVLGIEVQPMEFLGITMGVFTWLQYTFQYVSDWLLVLFSLERLAGFRFPTQHHVWRTRTRGIAGAFCGLIILSALLTCETVPYYYINIWRPAVAAIKAEDPGSCAMSSGAGQITAPHWLDVWESVQHIVDMVLPILISGLLFFLNTWLICHIKRHSWQEDDGGSTASDYTYVRNSSTKGSIITRHTKICAKQAKTKINRMLLGAVSMYFITQLPVVLLNLIGLSLSAQPYCRFDFFIRPYLQPIIWTIALVNYSGNFLVYFGVSHTYRRIFHQLFTDKKAKARSRTTRPGLAEWQALMQVNQQPAGVPPQTEWANMAVYNNTSCSGGRKPRNDSLSLGLKRRSAGDSQESLEHTVEGKSSKVRFSMED
ncbi:uncharacterized protein LOC129596150 isoform X2 [Paramacrobiotus metropolitanus]|uniref:uncharacterized protein LOC129596150 isoform X2 n=1 Tax=Paramacrobiotus metropolitanus TaxID=2943436 RepID=UPI002445FE12|nr:uncharacterized protein LOC129596150 isoform X2 [Paramacrobiotus metropolitanus]